MTHYVEILERKFTLHHEATKAIHSSSPIRNGSSSILHKKFLTPPPLPSSFPLSLLHPLPVNQLLSVVANASSFPISLSHVATIAPVITSFSAHSRISSLPISLASFSKSKFIPFFSPSTSFLKNSLAFSSTALFYTLLSHLSAPYSSSVTRSSPSKASSRNERKSLSWILPAPYFSAKFYHLSSAVATL